MIAAQVAHAAGECEKHPPGTHVVVLGTEDESHLARIADSLEAAEVDFAAVHEPDSPHEGALMALGIGLVRDRSKVKRVCSALPLLGKGL